MKIVLNKVKTFKGMSRGTIAFTAELVIDGVSYGEISNDGGGGCHRMDSEVAKRIDEWALTQPKKRWPKFAGGGEYQPDHETLINRLVNDVEDMKDYKRMIKNKVVGVNAKGVMIETKAITPAQMDMIVKSNEPIGSFVKVFNRMTLEEGFAEFQKAVYGDE